MTVLTFGDILDGRGELTGIPLFYHFSDRFNQKPLINQEGLDLPCRSEKAGSSLEGGLPSLAEGLGDLRRPCTRVLSVAGLLAVIGAFLGRKGFIPEVKRPRFLPEEGGNVQPRC